MTMEVSAEVHFAQTLASNDKKFRDRALKRLQKYIGVRSSNGEGLKHDDFLKLWKGLHYCMWMQDKPLIQEELSQKIVSLLHAFPKLQDALSFVNVFFITEAREWTGIDRLRLDKFMLLIREVLRETFELLSRNRWPEEECRSFSQNLTAVVMNEDTVKIPYGIKMHLADIYLVEMKKMSFDGMTAKKLTILMFPFIYFLLKTKRRELAQTVYDKTLKAALQEFGDWPWLNTIKLNGVEKPKFKKNRGQDEEEMEEDEEGDDDSGVERDDEQDDASEEEEEEEGSSEEDDDEEEEDDDDDMDVDEEKGKRIKYDLTNVLRLLHRLAQDPKVEVRNRRYVYGIVNSYASKDPTILQSQNDSTDEDDLGVTRVIQLTGETEKDDGDIKKRRRKMNKKRRKAEEQGIDFDEGQEMLGGKGEETSLSSQTNDSLNPSDEKNKKSKKKKKNNGGAAQEVVAVNGNNHVTKLSKKLTVGTKNNNKKEKSIEEVENTPRPNEHQVGEEVITSAKNKGKKRKRMSSDREGETTSDEVVHIKKMKISGDGDVDVATKITRKTLASMGNIDNKSNHKKSPAKHLPDSPASTPSKQKNKQSLVNNSDANSNARSPPRSDKGKGKKGVKLTSPMECVIYKQKSPNSKPANIDKLVKTIASPHAATTQFFVSESSPSRPATASDGGRTADQLASSTSKSGDVSANDKSPLRSKLSTPQTTPTTAGGCVKESGIVSGLYDAVIKKAVGLVAPATDPGVSREKIVATPDQWTPGGQKKVVFDLRRNKANKFQDYLKTLASPSPAFEPSRSPGQGILKSPSAESLQSSSGSNNSTPTSRRSKGLSSKRKSKSPVLRGIF